MSLMSYVLYYIVSTILYQVLLSSQLLYRKDVSLRDVGVGSHFDLLSRVVYALIEGPLALQYNCRRCLLAQLRYITLFIASAGQWNMLTHAQQLFVASFVSQLCGD